MLRIWTKIGEACAWKSKAIEIAIMLNLPSKKETRA